MWWIKTSYSAAEVLKAEWDEFWIFFIFRLVASDFLIMSGKESITRFKKSSTLTSYFMMLSEPQIYSLFVDHFCSCSRPSNFRNMWNRGDHVFLMLEFCSAPVSDSHYVLVSYSSWLIHWAEFIMTTGQALSLHCPVLFLENIFCREPWDWALIMNLLWLLHSPPVSFVF